MLGHHKINLMTFACRVVFTEIDFKHFGRELWINKNRFFFFIIIFYQSNKGWNKQTYNNNQIYWFIQRWADSISIYSISLIATDIEGYTKKKRYSATQQDNVSICFGFDWKLIFMLPNLMKMNFDKFSNHQAPSSVSLSILHTERIRCINFNLAVDFFLFRFIHEPRNKLAYFIINAVSNRIYVPCLMFIWSHVQICRTKYHKSSIPNILNQ